MTTTPFYWYHIRKAPLAGVVFTFVVLTATLSLWSCVDSGGSGNDTTGSSSEEPRDSSTSNTTGETPINEGVSGRLFVIKSKMRGDDKAYMMNLSDGRYQEIPNTDWETQRERFPLADIFFKTVSVPNELIVFSCSEPCRRRGYSLVGVQDFDGNVLTEFEVEYDIAGHPKLSPDGQHIAFFRELDEDWLEIYDLNGTELHWVNTDESSFTWLPDGRLVYIFQQRTFVFTKPYSTEYDTSYTLPDSLADGAITCLAPSPDGREMLFTLVRNATLVTSNGELWAVKVDDGSLRQVARYDSLTDSNESYFSNSGWSPDGSQIAVLHGASTGTSFLSVGTIPELYVMPGNGDRIFTVSSLDSERDKEVTLIKGYIFPEDSVESYPGGIERFFPNQGIYWFPD